MEPGSERSPRTASTRAAPLSLRRPGWRRRSLTAALLLGTFLASIEVTVVATAMPSIVDRLGGLALYPWVFSAYLLTQTISIPLYGRLADLYGRRRTYVTGVLLFLVGSVLCGLAPSMGSLVAARAVQGLGAGAVLPLTMTIFGDLYAVSLRTKLQGVFSLVWGVSALAGPVTGALIVQHASWPWIFYLNLPFGLISAGVVAWLLREPTSRREHRLDLGGAALLSLTTLLLLLALLPASQRPTGLPGWAWLGAAGLLLLGFVQAERRHPEPLVPLDLFRDRVHIAANGSGVLLGVVLFGFISFVPLYVQQVLGHSPLLAGAVLIPLSLGWTTASLVSGRLVGRVGFQFLVRAGCGLVGVGSLLGFAGIHLQLAALSLGGTVLYGLGMGATISSFTVSVQERVPPQRRGIATALTQFSRNIGGAIGVAALGAVLTRVSGGIESSAERGLDPEAVGRLASGLEAVFAAVAGAAVLAATVGLALYPRVFEGWHAPKPGGPEKPEP